jgi:glycosyltransferase involved in cell wall biosynthesis
LVEPKNPAAIADTILELIANPAKADELARRGRESVVAKYAGKIYAEKVGRLYEQLMERKNTKIQKHSKGIAYILGSFPGGNPPFIINEIKGLQKEGLDIVVCPIHKRGLSGRDANIDGIKALYADPIFSPKIIRAHFYYFFRKPGVYFKILLKNKVFGGKKIFWEGVYYARVINKIGIRHVHAHFAWNAADCARIIKRLAGVSFSMTAHQSDIHRFPERLSEKLEDAKFILTCTRGNKDYLEKKYGEKIGSKISVVYHGIDVSQFSPDIRKKEKDIDILSIGSLIKYKGFEYLIKACAEVKDRRLFRKCVIVGDGEDKDSLEALIRRLGLSDKVEIKDPVSHSEIAVLYGRAKSFILPITIIDGAPHGIPNVLAEAMAMGLPVIATNVPHIPELIENNKNGLLVADKDPLELANAIGEILSNEDLRSRLGEEARTKIISDFDGKTLARRIADIFKAVA